MISTLKLINAQRHVNVTLEFVEGVNVIRGATDAGKSSIFRSLRWVCKNKPASLNLLRRGTSKTEVHITKDGHTIVRGRTKSKNYYILDGVKKAGFGKDVPQEIADILDMDDTLHFQRQADPYFMLAINSPTERAKELERFTDLSIITRSIQKGRRTVRDYQDRDGGLRGLRKQRRKERDALVRFFAQNDVILLVFSLRDEIDGQGQLLDTLKEKHSILLSLSGKLERAEKAASIDLRTLGEQVADYDREEERHAALVRTAGALNELADESATVDRLLEQLNVGNLAGEIAEHDELEQRLDSLVECRNVLSSLGSQLRDTEEQLQETAKELSKIKVCKACGRPLDETVVCSSGGCPPNQSETTLPY